MRSAKGFATLANIITAAMGGKHDTYKLKDFLAHQRADSGDEIDNDPDAQMMRMFQ